jgi:cobalt/nickel transport protein
MIGFKARLWIWLGMMALLSPVGILVPAMFHAQGAWAEWDAQTLKQLVGYVPKGIKKYTGVWKPLIPDYNLFGEHASVVAQVFSYILASIIGVILVSIAVYALSRLVKE